METNTQTQQDDENSIDSVAGVQPVAATVMTSEDSVIESGEDGDPIPGTHIPETAEVSTGEEHKVMVLELGKKDCVIDLKPGEDLRGEKLCRICHIGSENSELIQLGCECKDELGCSHRHCAEIWFRHKGNRQCEVCGKAAKNITGTHDTTIFMLEWTEMRLIRSAANPSHRVGGCCCRLSLCNFLLACLVLAFVLPLFFRADIF